MEAVVLSCRAVKEAEIRPAELMSRYLALSREDAHAFLGDPSLREATGCPACAAGGGETAFEVDGFPYVECASCGSLYASPRPRADALDRFYRDSPSSRFWAQEFFPAVAEARRERLFRPRVERVVGHERLSSAPEDLVAVDVGAGAGMFLSELAAVRPSARTIAVEPGEDLAEQCRAAGLEVVEAPVEAADELRGIANLVTSFEVIEHVHDPLAFVTAIARLAAPGGTVLVTGLGGDGFDVASLGERANAVSPPHHLNFLSVAGLEQLFTRAGLTDVEVETPGQLDAELVATALAEGRGDGLPRFFRVLLEHRSEAVRDAFQRFLQEARLSSHVWIWARSPAGGAA
jgi:SAM-dependent methyltransferase